MFWVETSFKVTFYIQVGSSPFKESCWVVTLFKVACYNQVGSFAFQRDTFDCHLVNVTCYIKVRRLLFKRHVRFSPHLNRQVILKSGRPPIKEKLDCHLIKYEMVYSKWVIHLSRRHIGY